MRSLLAAAGKISLKRASFRLLTLKSCQPLALTRLSSGRAQGRDGAVVAFHGDGDRIRMALGVLLDAGEEILESRRRMRDLEFLQQTAVRKTDGNRVATRADINADTKLQRLGVQQRSLLQKTSPSDHPSVSSTCRATIASDRHHPGRPVG